MGGTIVVPLVSYRPPQAGQPLDSKVLTRHGLPASVGAWSLELKLNNQIVNHAPGKQRKNKTKTSAFRIGSWNVRTMRPGLSEDLQAIDDARKTAVIDCEMHRLNIDITALQETRLPENGSLKEEHYTFFWQGKSADETREQGVAFAMRNSLLQMIEPPTDGTERILKLRLSTVEGHVNIICV